MNKKFRYYIQDSFDGTIKGTDNLEAAQNYAESEDCFVVDTETNEWLQPEGERVQVDEVTP